MADALTDILRAADKHPNSRVSKLIHLVKDEPNQKNIVLLLIELAEHAEYSIDFNISLKYYLDLFQRLGINHDLVLNEAGMVLVNSSKIYSKRVDYVQSLVERQILTLSNADDELQKQQLEQNQNDKATPVEKPKNRRKRVLEAPSDPYEVELAPKKFKKLTEEKRFALPKIVPKAKSIMRNIEMEQHIHPAGWQCATIYDLENEEDVDTKRNYKLFTYHVEHRYNTLVPDINFRLHFKVKDYMDEQEEMEESETCNTDRSWPPLSEAYVQKYLRLENYVLQQDMKSNERNAKNREHRLEKQMEQTNHVNVNNTEESQQQNINTSEIMETIKEAEESALVSSSLITAAESNKSQESSEISNVNVENVAGLCQSVLSETSTLENTQHNSTLESSVTIENLNSNIPVSNKSLNSTECEVENDSALGTSVLEHSSSTENNTTRKSESFNITTSNENLNDSTAGEVNNSLSVTTKSQLENDSALGTSVLDQTSNTTAEVTDCSNLDITTKEEQITKVTDQTSSTGSHSTAELTQENPETTNAIGSHLDTAVKDGEATQQRVVEELTKATAENLVTSKNNVDGESGKDLKIDAVEQQDKKSTQIRIALPKADDEGVYLSDLEENDCHLLAPVIKTSNILPGVERKNVTIVMDEELRQALELRDDIMKHFGYETFKLPVITEAKKQKLIFNILKLPEKALRRKVLFKLGPDMDLYIKARTMKRSRPEQVTRVNRNSQFLKWFSLNNTDMTGVYMTPPYSPGHCSDFCGFSDNEDDTTSCTEFCGFTEEEQSMLALKHENRLSRDSGVGVDVNNLTPDKEPLEIIFNNRTDELLSVEGILKGLPAEIRNVLSTELGENISTTEISNKSSEDISSNSTQAGNNLSAHQTSLDKSEVVLTEVSSSTNNTKVLSELLITSNDTKETETIQNSLSVTTTEHCSLNNTNNSQNPLAENSSENQICTQKSTVKSEQPPTTQSENETRDVNNFEDNQNKLEINNSDDDLKLDWSSQGNKTKIQIWHEHLRPILAKSRERHHFDVFKLGTEIIETVQSKRNSLCESLSDAPPSSESLKTFHDVMEYKDPSYVSRYFLSTLLLANQNNIEITIDNKSSENPSPWEDINLKLLSTKRHTVAIEDNIGMIDSKQTARKQAEKGHSTRIQNKTINSHHTTETDEDEPLIKSQSKLKRSILSLKRSNSDITKPACIADKKPKQNSYPPSRRNSRQDALNNLIQNVQIIVPPFAMPPPTVDTTSIMPSTSRQAQTINTASFKVNINAIRTLQQIEKKLKNRNISEHFRKIKNLPIRLKN